MPHVQFTGHLRRYFPDLADCEVAGETLADVVRELDRRWPGLAGYLVDEHGRLRKHVNLFIGDEAARDRDGLTDPVPPDAGVYVMQALSGG